MQKGLTLLMVSIALTAGALIHPPNTLPAEEPAVDAAMKYFRRDASAFNESAKRLRIIVIHLRSGKVINKTGEDHKKTIITALTDCRRQYKKIESFLSCFFPTLAAGINGPPVYEGEDPFMEYQEPRGLQVMESILAAKTALPDLEKLLQQADLLAETSGTLPAILYNFHGSQAEILQSIRLGLIRLSALGITGYDAPSLKTGLAESVVVCNAFREQLQSFPQADNLVRLAETMSRQLQSGSGFDQFDRARFLRTAVIPFQTGLKSYCHANRIELPAVGLLEKDVTDIYLEDALRPATVFPRTRALLTLGEKWFNDKSLSRGGSRSCASCHQPGRAFTDGLPVSVGLNPGKPLKRNAPSLLYSAYQYRQFWDGKSAGLESQIFTVLHDPREMDIDTAALESRWEKSRDYRQQIAAAFPLQKRPAPSRMIEMAVGAYVSTLGGFNSPFDNYMHGDSSAMTSAAVNGFNLFIGKARCGSCHFAPVFNGTLPPDFERTEFEILGTTGNTNFNHPVLSPDIGRFAVYPLFFNKYSFKTPTVRNAARTAPYMHNGKFKTLEEVLTFYNNGGGSGMGLNVPGQTLASDSLHLDQQEMKDIIAFIYALNDKPEGVKQ